ncbi:MAG: ribosome assembly cofactor RimP [Salinivirgaceae bacterium]|nr:ribosome assembly cofactor RimP [Salinivirgaceae bacterium]
MNESGDLESPVLLEIIMIDTNIIEQLVNEKVEGSNLFLVEIKVDSANNIHIFVDSQEGVTIEQCVEISRHVNDSFDREEEDFSLEVSSPGIGSAFKVLPQYEKVIGRTVDILLNNGRKIEGKLLSANEKEIRVSYSVKEKVEGAKRQKWVDKESAINFENIKETIEIITF